MAENERGERNQHSRVITKKGSESKQLKEFMDNRAIPFVCQLVTDGQIASSLINIATYSSLLKSYDREVIIKVLKDNDLVIHGHHSGSSGDGINQATIQDIARLTALLQQRPRIAPPPTTTKKKTKLTPEQIAKGKANAAKKQAAKAAKKALRKAFFLSQNGKK